MRITVLICFSFYLFACSQEESAYDEEIPLTEYESSSAEKTTPIAGYTEEQLAASRDQQQEFDELKQKVEDIKNPKSIISSSGLTNPYKDKKFIKTADLHFRVSDVYQSTIAIEKILLANDGFLINSNLYADIHRSESYNLSKDSLVRLHEFQTRNNITLRIPNENMHESLLQIAEEIEFLDSRVLSADDVGLKLLAEEMAQKRNAKSAGNLQKSVQAGGKLDDKVYAEDLAFERETAKDIATLKELSLEDQVEYSTITIAIYQHTEISIEKLANLEVIKKQYAKPYSHELKECFDAGLNGLKFLLKFALTIWPIFVLIGLGFFVYRRFF